MWIKKTLFGAAIATIASIGSAGAQDALGVHLGVKTCANSACHGGAAPNPESKVQRNEYTFWRNEDPHSRAYETLKSKRAKRIARNLGLSAAHEAELCLDCHATNPPPDMRGNEFDIADGVQCESCHGASVGYLGIHATGIATREQNIQAGLYPTEDPIKRSEMCLDCHFGAKDQFANHRVMGAGHPRISFELDSYTWFNAHHTLDEDYVERKTYVDGVRTWAIGAAKMIERRMALLIDDETGTTGFFPEFVFFDCHACHHPLTQLRYKPDAEGVPPGTPTVDDSHMEVLRIALAEVDPALATTLDQQITELHKSSLRGREAMVAAAKKVQQTARQSVEVLAGFVPTGADMRAILARLASQGAKRELTDYASAEQAALVIGATIDALHRGGHIDKSRQEQLFGVLAEAYDAVQKEDKYDPDAFVQAMKSLNSLVQ